MADFTALKTAIQNAVKQNGNEEITGNLLQDVLLAIVTTLGDGSINGLLTALDAEETARTQADGTLQQNINAEAQARQQGDSTLQGGINSAMQAINAINNAIGNGCVYAGIATPSTTPAAGKVFYLALTAGTYTNFNGLEVSQGINILKNNGSTWSLDSFVGIDDAPTQGSANLVKSGGVLNSIIQNGPAFDLSAYNAQEGVLATYADLNAALTALNALPSDFKKGGMSMKFVMTSDNKYVQYRLTATIFTDNVTYWQKQGAEVKIVENTKAEGYDLQTGSDVFPVANNFLTNNFNADSNNICPIELGVIGAGINVESSTRARSVGYITAPFSIKVNNGYKIRFVAEYIKSNNGIAYYNYEKINNTTFNATDKSYLYRIVFEKDDDTETIQPSELSGIISEFSGKYDGLDKTLLERFSFLYDRDEDFPYNGYILGTNGIIQTSPSFAATEYLDISNVIRIEYCVKTLESANLAMVAFYDSEKSFISAIIGYGTVDDYHGFVNKADFPNGAKYVRITKVKADADHFAKLSFNDIDSVVKSNDKLLDVEKHTNDVILQGIPYYGKNQINIIGDSISEGARASTDYNDSYVGLLRHFISLELGKKLNYGFCQYGSPSYNIGSTMVVPNNIMDFVQSVNVSTYGTRKLVGSTVGNSVSFFIRKKFNLLKICYLAGPTYGEISVKVRTYENGQWVNTEIGTINCYAESETPMISEGFDISTYDAYVGDNTNPLYKVEVKSGTIAFSGIMLLDDEDWFTFNNYGASGAPASSVTGTLLQKYLDCDVVIYALGRNDDAASLANILERNEFIDAFNNARCKKIVLNLYFNAGDYNGNANAEVLKSFAKKIDALFIDLNDYAPKGADGKVIANFFGGDNMHPSDMGHRLIAEVIGKLLKLSVNSKGVALDVLDDAY